MLDFCSAGYQVAETIEIVEQLVFHHFNLLHCGHFASEETKGKHTREIQQGGAAHDTSYRYIRHQEGPAQQLSSRARGASSGGLHSADCERYFTKRRRKAGNLSLLMIGLLLAVLNAFVIHFWDWIRFLWR